MNFVWDFSKEAFEKCKTENAGDFVGNVRTGNLCIDLIQDEYDGSIWADCYVGGVDSGYGYSNEDNYPYDYCLEVGMSIARSEFKDYSYEQFLQMAEKELTESITKNPTYTAENGETVNLMDKANEPLKKW